MAKLIVPKRRRKLADHDRRTVRLKVRVSPAVHNALEQSAYGAHLRSASEFAGRMVEEIVRHKRPLVRVEQVVRPDEVAMTRTMGKIFAVLNEMADAAGRGEVPGNVLRYRYLAPLVEAYYVTLRLNGLGPLAGTLQGRYSKRWGIPDIKARCRRAFEKILAGHPRARRRG